MQSRIASLLSVAIAMSAGGVQHVQAQQVQVSPANRTIAITTTENAERRADMATLHVGYRVFAPDSASVYAEAARISNAVAAALNKLGVPKDAIASESQSTGPTIEFQNPNLTPEERAQRRFDAEQSWTVKTTPDAVAKLLAAAINAGANVSGQIDWSVADNEELTAEASNKALAMAKELAQQTAKGLGARVGNLLYASNRAEIAQQMLLPINGRVFDRLERFSGGLTPTPPLNLSAPMITRSATVSAIFAVE